MTTTSPNRTLLDEIVSAERESARAAFEGASTARSGAVVFPEPAEFTMAFNYTIEDYDEARMNGTVIESITNQLNTFVHSHAWVLWILLAVGVAIVCCLFTCIACWIYSHRQRIIRQRSVEKAAALERQLSESNLECYKRPSMPQMATSTRTHGTLLSAQRAGSPLQFTNIDLAGDVHEIAGVPNATLRSEQYRPLPFPHDAIHYNNNTLNY